MVLHLMESLNNHTSKVWSVAWSATGDKLASSGSDKKVNIWRFTGEKSSSGFKSKTTLVHVIDEAHKKTIRDVAFSPCGKFIALASFDSTVSIWEGNKKNSYECVTTVEGHDSEVKSVAWSPSGNFFATCGRDKGVMIWSMNAADEYDVECECTFTVHTQDVKRLVWHPHEDILASASYDDTIKLYRLDADEGDWTVITTLEGHTSTVWGIDFDKTGNRLVSCSDDKTLKVWAKKEGDNWICTHTISGFHDRAIYGVAWNHHNDLIATACGDNTLRIFKENTTPGNTDSNTFDCLFTTETHKGDVNRVSWNPKHSSVLASASDDGSVKLWTWVDE